jgi:hypothetical protein
LRYAIAIHGELSSNPRPQASSAEPRQGRSYSLRLPWLWETFLSLRSSSTSRGTTVSFGCAYTLSHSLVTVMNSATRLASRPCPVPSTPPTIRLLPYPQYCRCSLSALALLLRHILSSKFCLPSWGLHHFQGTIQVCFVLLKFLALLRLLLPIQATMSFFPV